MSVWFSSLFVSLIFKHEIPPFENKLFFKQKKKKSGEDQIKTHQIHSAPKLTNSSASNQNRVAPKANTKPPNKNQLTGQRDQTRKSLGLFLQPSHISHRAVRSLKQRTLPKLTGQSCKSTPYLRFDEEGWATVRKSSSLNTRSDHATLPTVQDKGHKPGQIMSTEAVSCLFVVVVHLHDV